MHYEVAYHTTMLAQIILKEREVKKRKFLEECGLLMDPSDRLDGIAVSDAYDDAAPDDDDASDLNCPPASGDTSSSAPISPLGAVAAADTAGAAGAVEESEVDVSLEKKKALQSVIHSRRFREYDCESSDFNSVIKARLRCFRSL